MKRDYPITGTGEFSQFYMHIKQNRPATQECAKVGHFLQHRTKNPYNL